MRENFTFVLYVPRLVSRIVIATSTKQFNFEIGTVVVLSDIFIENIISDSNILVRQYETQM